MYIFEFSDSEILMHGTMVNVCDLMFAKLWVRRKNLGLFQVFFCIGEKHSWGRIREDDGEAWYSQMEINLDIRRILRCRRTTNQETGQSKKKIKKNPAVQWYIPLECYVNY